jgi:pseudouridine-5'-phosphate glycosidase
MIEIKVPEDAVAGVSVILNNPHFTSILDPEEVPVLTVTSKGMSIFVSPDSPYGVDSARECEIHLEHNLISFPSVEAEEDELRAHVA